MANSSQQNVLTIGDLVEAAFDRAGMVTTDNRVAAGLAARIVARCLARAERLDLVRLLEAGRRPLAPGRATQTERPARAA
jgi:hypothetical protein